MEVNNEQGRNAGEHHELRKSSSMGSLYISTTITKPCVDSIINSVATIIHSQMIEVSQGAPPSPLLLRYMFIPHHQPNGFSRLLCVGPGPGQGDPRRQRPLPFQ